MSMSHWLVCWCIYTICIRFVYYWLIPFYLIIWFYLPFLSEINGWSQIPLHSRYAWWRHQMETFSAVCAGKSPVTGEFPAQRPVTRSFVFSLISVWINCWVHNRDTGDLISHRAHYDVFVMCAKLSARDKQNKQRPMILVGHPNKNDLIIYLVEHHLLASGFVIRECYKNACYYL